MYSHQKTQYEKIYIKVYENSRIKQNRYKISEKLVAYFFTIKYKLHKNS